MHASLINAILLTIKNHNNKPQGNGMNIIPFKLIQQDQHMLVQFTENLNTSINRIAQKSSQHLEALAKLGEQLSGKISWQDVNSVELAIIDYYDEQSIITEWQRRLADINRLPKNLQTFYQGQEQESDPDKLRVLLTHLITDLQWRRESKRIIRAHQGQMRTKIVMFFLLSFALFFSPTIFKLFFGLEFSNLRLYYIFTAATSGILGAAFSQLTSLQSKFSDITLEQTQAINQASYILARSIVGAGAGLIMFYLLQAGLLSGVFFPEFIQTSADLATIQSQAVTSNENYTNSISQAIEFNYNIGTLAQPPQGLSLLIIWCLLAGFSEKLIPGILNNKSKSLDEK